MYYKAMLVLAFLLIVSYGHQHRQAGLLTVMRARNLDIQPPTLSATNDTQLYRYEGSTVVSVGTTTTSSMTSNYSLAIVPQQTMKTDQSFAIVVEAYTDYRGNEEQPINNTKVAHQAVFLFSRDLLTGECTGVTISDELELKYLSIASELANRHLTPRYDDINRLMLSKKTTEEGDSLTIIRNVESPENGIQGQHSVAVSQEGLVQQSNASYSAQSGGQFPLLAGNLTFGEPAPNAILQANFSFVLKEKTQASKQLLEFIKQVLQTDTTIKFYTKEQFVAMVEGKQTARREPTSTLTLLNPESPNLRVHDDSEQQPILSLKGNQVPYSILTKTHPIIETFIFGKPFRVMLQTNISMVITDKNASSTNTQYTVTSRILMSYSGPTWTLLHSKSGFIGKNYNENFNQNGQLTMYVPIRYGDTRLNFALLVDATFTISGSHYLQMVGKQLSYGKKIRVQTNCKASVTVDAGNIRGSASLTGSMANFEAYEDTLLALLSDRIIVRDMLTAVVLPYSYHTYQAYQILNCMGPRYWYRGWRWNIIWCNASVNEDLITSITTPLQGRILSNSEILMK